MAKHKKFCVCGHKEELHTTKTNGRICLISTCRCVQYQPRTVRLVPGVSKYCQGTPPSEYSPSPEPEPIHW